MMVVFVELNRVGLFWFDGFSQALLQSTRPAARPASLPKIGWHRDARTRAQNAHASGLGIYSKGKIEISPPGGRQNCSARSC